MVEKTWLFVLCFFFPSLLAREVENKLHNYQVIEVGGIRSFQEEEEFFDKLRLPLDQDLEILSGNQSEGTLQVLVNPELREDFITAVRDLGLSQQVIIEDVYQLIQNAELIRANMADLKGEATFERYMTFEEIQKFMKTTQEAHPEKVKLSTIGQSYEGENITMITIADYTRRAKGKIRPIIFIEAGIHAREWISMASAVYLIDTLVNSKTSLTEEIEWKIVPVLNPDGYKYSWNKHRFWRKNRRPHYYSHCFGVDLNRNFDSYWNKVGTSSRRCSGIYSGSKPFSEPETKAIKDVFMDQEMKNRVKAYVSIHSYGQYILHPPGYNKIALSSECSSTLKNVAEKMSSVIQKSAGPKYTSGTPAQVLYPASGGSMDWAMLTKKIPLAFTFEMRDTGKYGFLLPASEIRATVKDIWVAVNELSKVVTEKDSPQLHYIKKNRDCEVQQISIRSNVDDDHVTTEGNNSETTEEPSEMQEIDNPDDMFNIFLSDETMSEITDMPDDVVVENEIGESSVPSTTSHDEFSLIDVSTQDTTEASAQTVDYDINSSDSMEFAATTESNNYIPWTNSEIEKQTEQLDEETLSGLNNPEILVTTEHSESTPMDVETDSKYKAPFMFRHRR